MRTLEPSGGGPVARTLERARALRPEPAQLLWLLPVFVYVSVFKLSESRITLLIGAVIGLAILALVTRHPSGALLVLIAVIPFQLLILSGLYRLGLPGGIARPMGSYRDLITAGLLVAAVGEMRRAHHRLDLLDKLALAYVALVAAYFLFPRLFVPGPSFDFAGPPQDLQVRFLALRQNTTFVLLLLAARHVRFAPDIKDRLVRIVLVVGAIVAGIAVVEFLAPDVWDRFCVQTLQVPRYWIEVLDYKDVYDPTTIIHHLSVAGRELVRPGSVFIDALQLGFYLLIPLGIAVEMILRQRTRAAYLLAGLYGVALLFANVRSAQIGALIIGFLAVRPAPGRSSAVRVRFMLVLAAGAVVLLPAAASSGFSSRAAAVGQSEETSTSLHWSSTREGIEVLIEHPLGLGLGTQPGVGTRFQVENTLTAENSYVGLGDELGIVTMALFIAFVIVLIRRLGRARREWQDTFVDAVRPTVIAVSVGAIFLHAWLYYAVGSTLLSLAGVALSVVAIRGHDAAVATDGR